MSLAQAASGLIGGIYVPFFGAWLAWRGLSAGEIGATISAGLLLRVFAAPVSGLIADAREDRRGMMLILYVVMLLAYAWLNFAHAVIAIAVATAISNIAGGAVSPLLESVSIRLADRYGFDYGHVRVWASTLFVLGNIASGAAVSLFSLAVVAPWLTVSLILNVAAVYALPAPPAGRPKTDMGLRLRATVAEARELMRSRVFLVFLLAASLDQGSHAFYYAYGGLHWRELGYSGALIGIIVPLGVIAEIGLMSISLHVFRVIGATRLLLLGGLGCALRWTILAFDPPLALVIVAQILHGATFAMAHLGAMYFILKAVSPRLSATAQSLYAVGSSGIAMGLATFGSGLVYANFGGRAYLLMAAMGAGAALFAYVLHKSWHGGRLMQAGVEEESGGI
ncbi:MAG: MFS transporter [Proteobacteria bacterium]|nr:MFS transporter [Pseudomonadota bacterium]